MKRLRRTPQSLLLLEPFSSLYKTIKTLSLYPQIHGSTDTHLRNSTISVPNLSPNFRSSNFGNTQLHNPTISDLDPSQNPKRGNLDNTHMQNATISDLIPSLVSKNNDFGNTHLPILSKQSEPMMKPYFLTSYMLFLSTFSKPISKKSLYHSVSPKFTQIRSYSDKSLDPNENSQPIDASSSIRKPISLWPGMYHSPVTNALWEARSTIFERPSVNQSDAPAESELVTKTPSQSRTSIMYKFSSDHVLWEQYRNPWNRIRMGKLVEDLDALAGTISYKHRQMHFTLPDCRILGRMKPLRTASQFSLLLKTFSSSPKNLETLSLYPQVHGPTNLFNFAISEPNPSSNFKNSNFNYTQLHNYDLNPSQNSQNNNLFNTFLLPDSTNTAFGKTHLPTSSKQSEPMIKTNVKPYFLTPNIFCLSYFSKPFSKTTSHHSISPRFTQIRPFSVKMQGLYESSQPVGSSVRRPNSLWLGMHHSPVTNAFWESWSSIFKRLTDNPNDAASESELITQTPSRSRTSIMYKFSRDYVLREHYKNPRNGIRMGNLMEDLDAMAGTISYKHCSNNDGTTRPILLVTASVDKIVLKKPICVDADLTITGAVTWVGRSSMEIQLEVTQSSEETSDSSDSVALVANFTFVARDSSTGKSALVNRLQPETEREKMLWEEAEDRNKIRKQKRAQNQKKEIDDDEIDRLNKLLAEGRVFCDMPALADRDSILIKETCLQNSLICQPQQRNIHGRIFGGFLMRRAFELAFATSYTFAGSAPRFLEVDHVDFLRPVDVGDFLRLKSCVLYTELEDPNQPLINVEVVAHVTRPECRSSEVSNKFYFTFTVNSDAVKNGLKIRNVVPATEEEARRVIERIDAETS